MEMSTIGKRWRARSVAGQTSAIALLFLSACGQSAEKSADQPTENPTEAVAATLKPSFDCAKASKPQEKLVCSDSELAELDVKLADAYSAATQTGDKAAILQAQRQWISQSFNVCSDKPCLVAAYQARINDLQNPPTSPAQGDSSSVSGAAARAALVSQMGPNGWARCVAGNVAIMGLVVRGDPVPANFADANQSLGDILGAMRNEMLANGTPAQALDNLVRGFSTQIRSGDDAARVVSECLTQVDSIISSTRQSAATAANPQNVAQPAVSRTPPKSVASRYSGQEPLNCRANVDCTSISDITNKMRTRWQASASSTPYSNACLEAVSRVERLGKGAWQFWPTEQRVNTAQSQMEACNQR